MAMKRREFIRASSIAAFLAGSGGVAAAAGPAAGAASLPARPRPAATPPRPGSIFRSLKFFQKLPPD